jgi:hypothetical protein
MIEWRVQKVYEVVATHAGCFAEQCWIGSKRKGMDKEKRMLLYAKGEK